MLGQDHRGRDDPPGRPGRRARPDEHPGRGRHELPGLPVRPPGPGRQQRDDDGPAQGRRRRRRDLRAARDGARAGQDRRLRRHRLVGRRSPAGGLNVIVTGQTAADVDKATDGDPRRRSPDQPDLANLKSDLVKATPEVQVTVDPNKAITVGMTAAQVAGQVRAALVAQPATSDPVRRRPDGPGRRPARSGGGRLGRRAQGAAGRDRRRRARSGRSRRSSRSTSRAASPGSTSGPPRRSPPRSPATTPARSRSRSRPSSTRSRPTGAFPAGTTAELAGVSQQQSEAFGGLFASMGVAILLVYVMMVLTFNSLVTPFVILFTCRSRRSAPSRRCT